MMKLLVLAQTPPPVHGQSLMVQLLVEGLPKCGIEVHHVQMRLSRSHADIGHWRPEKILVTLLATLSARRIARRERCTALYYVPSPAKRGAFYRDLVAMGICRNPRLALVLHWHAFGLGEWVTTRANPFERALGRRLLGGADLALVLAPELEADAAIFNPKRTVVVPNGLPDSGPPAIHTTGKRCEILFLGLGSREKGLFDTVEAVAQLNSANPGGYRLTFAGSFPSAADELAFNSRASELRGAVRHVGFADEPRKRALFGEADLFCLPTRYPHEGQPLALIEAMANDLRIVTSRWRAIPRMLPPQFVWYAEPGNTASLATAVECAAGSPPPGGASRRHFLTHFTIERHLAAMTEALSSLDS